MIAAQRMLERQRAEISVEEAAGEPAGAMTAPESAVVREEGRGGGANDSSSITKVTNFYNYKVATLLGKLGEVRDGVRRAAGRARCRGGAGREGRAHRGRRRQGLLGRRGRLGRWGRRRLGCWQEAVSWAFPERGLQCRRRLRSGTQRGGVRNNLGKRQMQSGRAGRQAARGPRRR